MRLIIGKHFGEKKTFQRGLIIHKNNNIHKNEVQDIG